MWLKIPLLRSGLDTALRVCYASLYKTLKGSRKPGEGGAGAWTNGWSRKDDDGRM